MYNKVVSVVIPVYNVKLWLEKSVQSVLAQTYQDLEIILVDDGSTDGSSEICDSFSEIDSRIQVVHQTNGGLADARNTGMRQATGEYLMFLDSDDWLEPDFIERLVFLSEEHDLSTVVGRHRSVKSEQAAAPASGSFQILSHQECLEKLLLMDISTSAWAKLYRKEVWNGVSFEKGRLFEDVVPMYQILSRQNRVGLLDYAGYNYRLRPGSITKSKFNPAQYDYVRNCGILLDLVRKTNPFLEQAAIARKVWADLYITAHITSPYNKQPEFAQVWKEVCVYRASLFRSGIKPAYKVLLAASYLGPKFVRLLFQLTSL